MMHDHTGSFDTASDMVNTPELMQADNDYAVGLLVQKVANSVYAQNTLIFVIEDDAQDGADHVDSHRTIAFIAGAYVKQGAVISTAYNTVDFIRTMEEILGVSGYEHKSVVNELLDLCAVISGAGWGWRIRSIEQRAIDRRDIVSKQVARKENDRTVFRGLLQTRQCGGEQWIVRIRSSNRGGRHVRRFKDTGPLGWWRSDELRKQAGIVERLKVQVGDRHHLVIAWWDRSYRGHAGSASAS
ncbi:MAG TPA: hypothetical protein VMP68_06995 [Candidatus Eisenbacteria bacterium]|nr:hypothetical protein [Candidatus Eisenbacteria bacterium]